MATTAVSVDIQQVRLRLRRLYELYIRRLDDALEHGGRGRYSRLSDEEVKNLTQNLLNEEEQQELDELLKDAAAWRREHRVTDLPQSAWVSDAAAAETKHVFAYFPALRERWEEEASDVPEQLTEVLTDRAFITSVIGAVEARERRGGCNCPACKARRKGLA